MSAFRFFVFAAALAATPLIFSAVDASAQARPANAKGTPTAAAGGVRHGAPIVPISAPFVVRTADGLPIEVELIACFKGEAQFRNTASGRVFPMALNKLDKVTQKFVEGELRRVQAKVEQLPTGFGVRLETNTAAASRPVAVRADLALEVRNADNSPRSIPGFGSCVRFAAQLPASVPVELPVDVKIIWAYQETSASRAVTSSGKTSAKSGKSAVSAPASVAGANGLDNIETVRAILTNTPGEYLSKPVGKGTRPFRGYGVIVLNVANGAILWRGGDGSVVRDYLAANPNLVPSK